MFRFVGGEGVWWGGCHGMHCVDYVLVSEWNCIRLALQLRITVISLWNLSERSFVGKDQRGDRLEYPLRTAVFVNTSCRFGVGSTEA